MNTNLTPTKCCPSSIMRDFHTKETFSFINWFTTTQKTLSKASFLMHQILASKIVHSFEIETEISFAKWAFSLCTVTLTFHFCLPILLPFCLLIYACKALPNMLCMNQGSKKERVNILNLFKVNDTWRGGIGPSTQQKCWGSSCYGF